MNEETFRLVLDLVNSSRDTTELTTRLHELKKTTETTGEGVDKLEQKTDKLGKTGMKSGQSLLQGGRVLQDFAQGGLGGILNNIEGLTMALGMGPGLAGVLTVVGVAALVAGPAIKSFVTGWIDGQNAVPKSADAIQELTDKIKANAEALDTMKKAQHLTNTELAEFNRLTGEQIGNQKAIDAAKKAQAAEKKLDEMRPQGAAEAERGRAEELQAQFGGRQDEIVKVMDKNDQANVDRITKQIRIHQAGIQGEPTEQDIAKVRAWQKQLVALEDQQKKGNKGLLAGAMVEGKEKDIKAVMEKLPMLEGLPGADVFRGMKGVLPENIAAADKDDENRQAGLDERGAAVKRRNANLKRKADVDKKQAAADASTDEDMSEGAVMKRKQAAEEKAQVEKDQREQAEHRAKNDQRLAKNLGPGFMADAQSQMLALDPKDRRGHAALTKTIRHQAWEKLSAEGSGQMEAMAGSQRAEGMMRGDLGRKLDSMGGRGQGNQQQLFGLLQQILGGQNQQNGLTGNQMQQLQMMQQNNQAGLQKNRGNASNGAQ